MQNNFLKLNGSKTELMQIVYIGSYFYLIQLRCLESKMATPFKIPKRKQPTEADSLHMQSPLSRLQDPVGPFESSWCNRSSNGTRPEQVGSLNGHISRAMKESTLRDVCKVRLGPGHPGNGSSSQSTAFQRPGQAPSSSHQLAESDRWRPKRASDTLCRDENQQTGCVPTALKTCRADVSADSVLSVRCSPVESDEELELNASPGREAETDDRYPGSPRDPTRRRCDSGRNGSPPKTTEKERKFSGTTSTKSSLNGIRSTGSFGTSPRGSVLAGHGSQNSDGDNRPVTSGNTGTSPGLNSSGPSLTRATQEKRLSLGRSHLPINSDVRGGDRRPMTRFLPLCLRLKRHAPSSTETSKFNHRQRVGPYQIDNMTT
ncbi:hypothetical protein DPEC_G00155090 [Dallia pectoralis]|uniref:Uncharacterized protein n=1 Tax=Dallia pectoralis TaxID=75939 RepID=A0ACC2GKE1_DALPE|nr:hypothetical protein DPEC_G00155090 [Dallia pectoralis]